MHDGVDWEWLVGVAIGATVWQKGFICRCHYFHCHSEWKSLIA